MDRWAISYSKAMAEGIEAHNFNSNIYLRTATSCNRASGNDDNSISGKTLANSVLSVEDFTTPATNNFHARNNLEDDDEDSFALSIATTQSHLEGTNGEAFRDVQDEITNLDEQSS